MKKSTLKDLTDVALKETVNVAAVVFSIGDTIPVQCYDSIRRGRQNVTLVDHTKKMVTLTMWGSMTGKLNESEGRAVVLQNLQVNAFHGKKTLSTTYNSVVDPRTLPNDPDKLRLQIWWDETGQQEEFESVLLHPTPNHSE